MQSITAEDRRARLVVRHRLAPRARATDVADAARSVIALHATDPASIYVAARARTKHATIADVEAALYDHRTVVRMLGMRRTMFVVPVEDVGLIEGAVTKAIAARERKRLVGFIEGGGITDDAAAWLRRAERLALRALEARGEATGAELSGDVPELQAKVMFAEGKKWGGEIGLSTRVLFLLSADGHIVRGRPAGTWISSQHRWAPAATWFAQGVQQWPTGEARTELVRRWLAVFGPGTVEDIKWWTGLTLGEVRKALTDVETTEVDLDGASGLVLADDLETVGAPAPFVALLPALDPTAMGWKDRDWFLGSHRPALFDRNGNIGPTVWWEGRVVGGWAVRKDGGFVYRLLEDVGRAATKAVDAEGERLLDWLGPARFTPRFRTPLEIELTS